MIPVNIHDNKGKEKAIDVLLVVPRDIEEQLTRYVLNTCRVCTNLYVVKSIIEALCFLRREEKYQDVPRPLFVIVNLELPKREIDWFACELLADQGLKHIPVVESAVAVDKEYNIIRFTISESRYSDFSIIDLVKSNPTVLTHHILT
ncbi:MAG: hypothetical protein ACFFD4_29155 [Candidatus Odinarchaeota archaeon]